jgi:plasmid stabilization system protein ParE
MKILVLETALDDLEAGFLFYENQANGLGAYFLDALWSDIESLNMYAKVHSVHFGYYRLLAKRFPFAVYYKISGEIIHVFAILDCRQHPSHITKRLNDP